MTCIAWDGKTLAADKRSCGGSLHSTVTKIFKVNGTLVGVSGDFVVGMSMLNWLLKGGDAAAFPEKQKVRETYATVVQIDTDGKVWKYEDTPYPFRVEEPFYAIGSGRDFAIAAMHYGKSSLEAVLLASRFDPGCGNGVDALRLD